MTEMNTQDSMAQVKLWTIPEAQTFLRCGRRAIFTLIRQKRLHAVRIGGKYCIPDAGLRALVDAPRDPDPQA